MASNTATGYLIDSFVKLVLDTIALFSINLRVQRKLELATIWNNCGLKTPDGSTPTYKSYQPTGNGYKLVFRLPIGLCPSDFTSKEERLTYAFRNGKNINISTDNHDLIIKVTTIDGKPLS